MFSSILPRRVFPALVLLALLVAPACTSPTSTSSSPLQALDYAGNQQAVESLDREIADAGQDSAKLDAIATRLIRLLRDPGTTPAARQAICQRLGAFSEAILTAGDNGALFVSMFADEKKLNDARLALDLVPGAAVDALYLRGLKESTAHTRLAFVQSIGNRHIAAAVPVLTPLLNDSDSAVAAATLKALGQIGTHDALVALSTAQNPASAPVIEARLAAAHHVGGAEATREFQAISESPNAPANLRAAAVHGLLFAEPDAAPARFVTAISGNDAVLKAVVIEAIAAHPSKELVSVLSAHLIMWDAPTQAAVIAALGRKGDVAAGGAVSAATQHPDPTVRAAAIGALGKLPGNPAVAILLGHIAAGNNADEAKLARQSLSRLDGPGVSDAVVAGATSGEQPLRVVFLEQIASRNMISSLPLLLATRRDPVVAVRSVALASLAEIAPPSEQHALLEWAIGSDDAFEQSRALRALASVTLRNPDTAQRSILITDAIEHAPAAVALRLLSVLPRIGGAASAESAARLALHDDVAVSAAAVNTLSRWPDRANLLPLVDVAEKTSSDTTRSAAIQGVVRTLERNRDLSSADLTAIVARLAPICREMETRTRLVYLLGRSSGEDALALATKLQSDAALTSVATDAATIIRSNRAGRPSVRASGDDRKIKNILDGKLSTRWSVPMRPDQWVEVDFKLSRPLRQIVLDNNGETWGYPEAFAVFVTDDLKNPGAALVTGAGQSKKTTIDLPAGTRGRYLIIRQTAEVEDSVWAISELIID